MATRTIVEHVDDLTGEPGEDVSIVEFSLDSTAYEIDLSSDNAARFRDQLSPYISAGRKVAGKGAKASARQTGGTAPAKRDPQQTKAIREWARNNGYMISDRGRIPGSVEEAYNKNDASLLTVNTLAPVG